MQNQVQHIKISPANMPTSRDEVSPINRVITDIEAQLSILRDNIMSLDRVFNGVLAPEVTEKICSEPTPMPPRAPLEGWLHEQLDSIMVCNDRIANYKQRCQL